jgi:hypothetical protein
MGSTVSAAWQAMKPPIGRSSSMFSVWRHPLEQASEPDMIDATRRQPNAAPGLAALALNSRLTVSANPEAGPLPPITATGC